MAFHYNSSDIENLTLDKTDSFNAIKNERVTNLSFVVKQSALSTNDIVSYLKDLFTKHNSVSVDYEGDHTYLAIDQLTDLLEWVRSSYGITKRFYYTIAVRSTYDILHVEKDDSHYIQQILSLYEKYNNFHIILVAGNRKYVDLSNQKMHMKERFQTWIQELQQKDFEKEIFIGADNIFKLARSLLNSYKNTKAILLKSSNLSDQMKLFNVTLQDRLGVYSLLIESDEKAVALEYVRGYLQRRGIEEQHYKEKVLDYAIQHDDYYNVDLEQKYNFMFLFSIEG